jgi:hypothetical protein
VAFDQLPMLPALDILIGPRRSSSVAEQGTHKPLAGGSNPPSATNFPTGSRMLLTGHLRVGDWERMKAWIMDGRSTVCPRPGIDAVRAAPDRLRRYRVRLP